MYKLNCHGFGKSKKNFSSDRKSWTKEEILCEIHFKENVRRAEDGRFIITIPLKDPVQILGDSYEHARRRYLSLETRLEADSKLKERYSEFMSQYQSLGHMTKVGTENANQIYYYMPHHGIVREESLTTKLRVVFDASAPTSSGISLNNIQMRGPTLQSDLLSILLRFRKHRYVVSGDIEKMYRQILIAPEQRCLQRILWRHNMDKPFEVFELNTVTYGTAAASFLAVRCLMQLAEENNTKHPQCSEIIRTDFYMDDLLTGADSIDEAASIAKTISDILKQGRFELRKFYSNNLEALKYVTENNSPNQIVHFGVNENAKTLGLTWSPVADVLMYNIGEVPKNQRVTKRTILSSISQIFDPLALLSPCIVKIKMLLQQLWLEKLSWDEGLPLHIHSFWNDYRDKLHVLNDLRIQRLVICENPEQVEIHTFSDASEKGYGGCVFVRSVGQDGKIHVHLLCAKTKVAPLKVITLPRLELLGALIAARLAHKVSSSMNTKISRRTFWCDSTIVLGWLKLPPNKLKTFVSNKVTEIQELTSCDNWRHVPSKENPTDILSRGTMPNEIKNSSLWWNGPPWLREKEDRWPVQASIVYDIHKKDLPEIKPTVHVFLIKNEEGFSFKEFSSFTRLKRVVAWILRFADNCTNKTKRDFSKCLSVEELNRAFKILIKQAQWESFNHEVKDLRNHKQVHCASKILNLNPFLDDEGVLRVGGRLENSKFSYQKKHPVLLSAKHHLTRLIIKNEHLKLLHAGPQQLLAAVREEIWPIGGRNLCKGVVRECWNCFRNRPRFIQPIMGELPAARVEPGPVFNVTGVDYAGPLLIKYRKGRGTKLNKCYIGLFICFSTKAIHLEIISDLSKDSFIMALRRFVARRGRPSQILSDNGTNFVAAHSELKQLFKVIEEDVVNHCAQENIQWKFIPPYSPHFGGLWEAGVKASKFHLKRVLCNAHLTFEELYTVIVQIEAILNSRPLFPLSADPDDLTPLTPAHFLVGRTLTAVPEVNVKEIPVGRLSRFQHLQQCQQHFWTRWQKEYIAELQRRVKWKKTQGELKIGSLVLLRDDNAPPLRWKLGRVTKLHPGRDGKTRVATVRTQTGETKRAYAKLCPLPEPED